jgi:hypothetical protein
MYELILHCNRMLVAAGAVFIAPVTSIVDRSPPSAGGSLVCHALPGTAAGGPTATPSMSISALAVVVERRTSTKCVLCVAGVG